MASGYLRGISVPLPTAGKERKQRSGRKKGGKSSKAFDKYEYHNGAQVQNMKGAGLYVFGDSNVMEDDETVLFEMSERTTTSRHRGTSAFSQEISEDDLPTYFEREIEEGETLQAISLKYACPISVLKRLNNLIQDQEFFALKVVKVPMKKHGILSEEYAKNLSNVTATKSIGMASALSPVSENDPYSSYLEDSDSHPDLSDPETQIKVMRTLSIRDNMSAQGKEAEKFLRKMDSDLAKLKQDSSRKERESLSEVISVLTNKSIHPLDTTRPVNKHNGADCGMSWWSVMVYSLILGIAVPIIFLIYFFFFKS